MEAAIFRISELRDLHWIVAKLFESKKKKKFFGHCVFLNGVRSIVKHGNSDYKNCSTTYTNPTLAKQTTRSKMHSEGKTYEKIPNFSSNAAKLNFGASKCSYENLLS